MTVVELLAQIARHDRRGFIAESEAARDVLIAPRFCGRLG
jgi:hypothetical protein